MRRASFQQRRSYPVLIFHSGPLASIVWLVTSMFKISELCKLRPVELLLMRRTFLRSLILVAILVVAGCGRSQRQLRILTYNIHHGEGTDGRFDLARIADLIKAQRPDLVALQEVDRKTTRASGVDQAAELARLTGMSYAYGPAMDFAGGEYGEAILSRFSLMSIDNYILPWPDGSEPRALLVVRVEAKGIGSVRFGGTHLAHDSAVDRLEQAQRINEILAGQAKMILAGDLNATPGSAPMREFDEHWLDAAGATGSPEPTYPNVQPQRRIDYVLVRPGNGWRVLEARVIEGEIASDHCPVLLVLQWHNE